MRTAYQLTAAEMHASYIKKKIEENWSRYETYLEEIESSIFYFVSWGKSKV